jgi:hypothetical protein
MDFVFLWCIAALLCPGIWSFNNNVKGRPLVKSSNILTGIETPLRKHRLSQDRCRQRSISLWLSSPLEASSPQNSTIESTSSLSGKKTNETGVPSSSYGVAAARADDRKEERDANVTVLSEDRQKILAEAEVLRERARKLRAEAMADEIALRNSRSNQQSQRSQDGIDLTNRLFQDADTPLFINSPNNSLQEQKIADSLRKDRWSPDQVMLVLEHLVQQQMQHQEKKSILTPSQAAVNRPSSTFQIGDTRNAAIEANETKWLLIDGWISSLINAASILDDEYNDRTTTTDKNNNNNNNNNNKPSATQQQQQQQQHPSSDAKSDDHDEAHGCNIRWTGRVSAALRSRRKELVRAEEEELNRRIAANVNAVVRASKAARITTTAGVVPDNIEEYTRRTLGLLRPDDATSGRASNRTITLEQRLQAVPMWVPSSLLPYLVQSRATLVKEDVKTIKDMVLLGSRFFCTDSDAIPSAAIFRGNIRTPVGLVDTAAISARSGYSNHTAIVFQEIQERLQAEGLAERVQLFMLEDPEWRQGKDARVPKPLPVLLAIAKRVEPTESAMEKFTTSKTAKVRSSTIGNYC